MRTEQEILWQPSEERFLNATIGLYYEDKKQLDHYKTETEEANRQIKELMTKLGITSFETDNGLTAKISTQKRESFMEDKLIAKLKELNIITPIKTIEVIDYDELENLIYNNKLDASELTDCKQVKEVITLKVK